MNLLSPQLWKWLIFSGYFRTTYLKPIVLHHLSFQSSCCISQTVASNKVLWVLRYIVHSGKAICSKIEFLVYIIKSPPDWCSWIAVQCKYPALLVGNKQLKSEWCSEKKNKIPIIFGRGPVHWAIGEPGLRCSICLFCLHVTVWDEVTFLFSVVQSWHLTCHGSIVSHLLNFLIKAASAS